MTYLNCRIYFIHVSLSYVSKIISTSWAWPPKTQRMEGLHWYVGLWVGGHVGVVKPCPAVVASMLPQAERSVLWLGCVWALLWCSQTHWCSPGVQVELDLQLTFSTHGTIDGAGLTSLRCISQWIWTLHGCIWLLCQYWSVSTHLAMGLQIRQNVLPAMAHLIFQSEIWLY